MRSSILGLAFAILAASSAVRADIIFLKDGTVFSGKIKKESEVYVDPVSKDRMTVARGYTHIDDGARRIQFGSWQLREVLPENLPVDVVLSARKVVIGDPARLPPILEVLETTPFDEKWNRRIKYRGP